MKPYLPLILPPRSQNQLQDSLDETLARKPKGESGVWLFVYGLLAKEPPFKYVRCEVVRLEGWERRFHLADPMNRGDSLKPGLTLGLERGEMCEGVAYLIADADIQDGLMAVWKQEMLLPFYTPEWTHGAGRTLLTMVTDAESPALWRPLEVEEIAPVIREAEGKAGGNTEYLSDVIQAFGSHGIRDAYLDEIQRLVEAA